MNSRPATAKTAVRVRPCWARSGGWSAPGAGDHGGGWPASGNSVLATATTAATTTTSTITNENRQPSHVAAHTLTTAGVRMPARLTAVERLARMPAVIPPTAKATWCSAATTYEMCSV